MKITKNKISFTAEESFDLLHRKNYQLWREAVDLIAEYAQECFDEYHHSAENLASPVEDGIQFADHQECIYFSL